MQVLVTASSPSSFDTQLSKFPDSLCWHYNLLSSRPYPLTRTLILVPFLFFYFFFMPAILPAHTHTLTLFPSLLILTIALNTISRMIHKSKSEKGTENEVKILVLVKRNFFFSIFKCHYLLL